MAVYLPTLTAGLAGVGFAGGLRTVAIALLRGDRRAARGAALRPQISRPVHPRTARTNPASSSSALALLVAGMAGPAGVCGRRAPSCWASRSPAPPPTATPSCWEPLRDLFAALFFVVFGLEHRPATMPPVLGLAIAAGAGDRRRPRWLTGVWAADRAGIGVPGRRRAGAALIARGEFSIVIAGLAVASGAVPRRTAPPSATAYVMLLAVLGPVATRFCRAARPPVPAPPQDAGHEKIATAKIAAATRRGRAD